MKINEMKTYSSGYNSNKHFYRQSDTTDAHKMEISDLKCELFDIKKKMQTIATENNLLKVKVRKLEHESLQKSKQIEELLDPRKSYEFRKILTDKGALLILNLKQRNENLENEVLNKDLLIRKQQQELQTLQVYSGRLSAKSASPNKTYGLDLAHKYLNSSPYGSPINKTLTDPLPHLCRDKLNHNLEQIKVHRQVSATPLHNYINYDNEPSETYFECEQNKPEPELNNIGKRISKLLNEITKMKVTVSQLSTQHVQTRQIIEQRSTHMEQLAQQMKDMRIREILKRRPRWNLRHRRFQRNIRPAAAGEPVLHSSAETVQQNFHDASSNGQEDSTTVLYEDKSINLNHFDIMNELGDDDEDVKTEFYTD